MGDGLGRRAAVGAVALAALLHCPTLPATALGPAGPGHPGIDPHNTRQVSGPIDSGSVARLRPAWSVPLTGTGPFGSHAAPAAVSGGRVYSQDLSSNVQAIELATGEVLWTKRYESRSVGPNGVVVAGDLVFGATAEAAFALDRESGTELWSTSLVRNASEGIDMVPGYRDGRVYVSTVPVNANGNYRPGGVGVLWALDAESGGKLWRFDTVPEDLWGMPEVNSGGGLWYPPSFDGEGSVYFGVGNPAPFPGTQEYPWGSSRPGPNLYTNSVVKLDEQTGELRWYYQQTPHDLYDWDFQDPPVLVDVAGRQLAIGAGKSGFVVALDRNTGEPVWSRPVGVHNGHDDDPIFAMQGEFERLTTPATVLPGKLGGVIAPMAANGSTLFVPVVNGALSVLSGSQMAPTGEMSGELVALDLASGAVRWSRAFASPVFGAPTAVNDLVFVSTFDGVVRAFRAANGELLWSNRLPAGANTGVSVAGDSLLAPAGVALTAGQAPALVAYRLADAPAGDDAATPAAPPSPSARAADRPRRGVASAGRTALVLRGRALLRMRCRGTSPCQGVVRLRAPRRSSMLATALTSRRPTRSPFAAGSLGRARFRIAAGRSRLVPVRLRDRAGGTRRGGRGWEARAALAGPGLRRRTIVLRRTDVFLFPGRPAR